MNKEEYELLVMRIEKLLKEAEEDYETEKWKSQFHEGKKQAYKKALEEIKRFEAPASREANASASENGQG